MEKIVLSETWLVDRGIYDETRSMMVEGMLPTLSAPERDEVHGEHFNRLPFKVVGPADIRVEEQISPGEKILIRIRGAGQFGCFRKAVSAQEDWKLSVFLDNDRTTKLAEFTG